MPVLDPQAFVEVAPIPNADDLQISPLVILDGVAIEWNAESGAAITGRFIEATGEAVGTPTPKMQDTYKHGTPGRTGRAFDVVTGAWQDDWVSPFSGKYGLLQPDSSAGVTWDVRDHVVLSDGIHQTLVMIGRGIPPAAVAHNAATVYAYLELAYGDTSNYRIAMEWGQPIRLDYLAAGSAEWKPVAIARNLGNLENYLAANDREVRLQLLPDYDRNLMTVEVGSGHWLRHSPPRPLSPSDYNAPGSLPDLDSLRFTGQNGWATLEVYPLRYAPLRVRSAKRKYAELLPNLSGGSVTPSGLGRLENEQTLSGSVEQDGLGDLTFDVTASRPDAGDGLGSQRPPTLSGIQVILPAYWGQQYIWAPVPEVSLEPLYWEELQVFDDVTRTVTHNARIVLDNKRGQWAGTFGNYALNLVGSNGISAGQRLRGILAGGINLYRQDPAGWVEMSGHDFSRKLLVPLGQPVRFDGWCLYSAVRAILEMGQISPKFQQLIPYWPFGAAGADCPYPILGRGIGNAPKYEFPAEMTCLSALLYLTQDAGIPSALNGANVPFVTGQDVWGNWLFEPYDPRYLPVLKGYSDNDSTGLGSIYEIQVFNSVDQMRTELNFMGQDPYTGELLFLHFPMPWNIPAVGYRYTWLERNSRWVSPAYLEQLAYSAATQASLPQQVVTIKTSYDPLVNVGQRVYIEEQRALGRGGIFIPTMIHSRCGLADWSGRRGEQLCESLIVARAEENLIPF